MPKPHKTSSRPVRKPVTRTGGSKAPAEPRGAGAVPVQAPADIAAFIARSVMLYRKGQIREALEAATQGLVTDPDNAVLLSHHGVFAAALGESAAAEASYRRAIAVQPDSAEIRYNLGNLLKAQNRPQEAEAAYRRAIELNPDSAEAHCNLGNLLAEQQRADEAEALCRRAIALRPDYAQAHSNLGNLLQASKRPQEAEAAYRRALAIKPDYAEAWSNLGVLLKAQKRAEEAEAAYLRAIATMPDHAEAHSNLGVLLMEQKRFDEAEAACRRAIALRPDYADAYSNLGNLLQMRKRPEEAEAAYRRAVALKPDHADAHWNLSLLLLRRGRLPEGWMEFEARYAPNKTERRMAPPPVLPDGIPLPPQWQGELLAGKSLLIWPEQGLGDEIQFVRYLPMLKARGARHLTLACKPPLKALFAAQGLADRVISTADWRPAMAAEFDFWCYPLSLPLHFATTLDNIPAAIPYLKAEPAGIARWASRLPPAGPRVGLVWKGSPTHKNDASRSLPSLAILAPFWSLPGIAFVSLQKGSGEEEAGAPPAGQPLMHLGGEMADFADSAAILSQLDLLICVDTAAAHLAGALGKPCWVLLPDYKTDWRWLEARADSPWYPRVMRLFRQTTDDDWGGVVDRVVAALKEWMAGAGRVDSAAAAGKDRPPPHTRAEVAAVSARSTALYRQGQFTEALAIVTRALAVEPDNAVLLNQQGIIAAKIGDAAAAEAAYRRALILKPDYAEGHFNLGVLLKAQGRPREAEAAYRRALETHPDSADAWSNLGVLLTEQKRPDEAEAAYRRAIALVPDHAEAHSNLGVLLRAQERLDEAEAAYRRAIAARPDSARAYSNLGNLLKAQNRLEEAEAAYRRAIATDRDSAEAHYTLAILLKDQKRVEDAEAAFRRAIACKPDYADARFDLSLLLLRGGRYREGWIDYEARYAPGKADIKVEPPSLAPGSAPLPPQWTGESLTGKSLLVWPEQGFGDEIQFVRYLPLLKQRGLRHLTLACKPPLRALFAAQGLADRVIGVTDWRPEMAREFDFWCYALSLPLQFATTLKNLPATIPYLKAAPDSIARWAKRLPPAALRVGLVWKGRPTHGNDANRSLPSLAVLAPLWSVPGVAFVSLQKGAGEDEAAAPPVSQPLTHLGAEMEDFADSAAILSQLDLLICVDTAAAHLAAALGVPCWLLLPDHRTDWRWLEGRVDSPWYPNVMRLFRQNGDRNWDGVVTQILAALKEWTAAPQRATSAVPPPGVTAPVVSPLAPGWRCFGRNPDLQTPFDVAVVMPTIGRECILEAVRSVYAQENVGRIQLLIGVDQPRGDFVRLHELLDAAPAHVTPCLFYPGYSTSQRHGGLHPAFDGGVLRTVLSYLANARHLAYLDDDNWWAPGHVRSLLSAVQGRDWAFALRWFVHPESRRPVCVDEWESVGPGRGVFLPKFGGWVDPNCLLIDKLACEPVLRWWSIPLPDKARMAADRHVFAWLQKHSVPGETGQASVYYEMQPKDVLHPRRLERIGQRYAEAGRAGGGLPSAPAPD
ncbi:MAG: tetratricopeptide repeat protein [Sulfuritalea sp.]|nr:tetratricopeptide repeat protein [Sulfuritalea sp.]